MKCNTKDMYHFYKYMLQHCLFSQQELCQSAYVLKQFKKKLKGVNFDFQSIWYFAFNLLKINASLY